VYRIRNRPEVALTHLQLAELLLDDGDSTARSPGYVFDRVVSAAGLGGAVWRREA
jgi:hypothetical protein